MELFAVVDKHVIADPFYKLTENSTLLDIQKATTLLYQLKNSTYPDFTTQELNVFQAKINYVSAYKNINVDANILNSDIDKLTLTSKTLFADTEKALDSLETIITKLDGIQTTFSDALNTEVTDTTDPVKKTELEEINKRLTDNVPQFQNYNNPGFNKIYINSIIKGNVDVLDERARLVTITEGFIDQIVDVDDYLKGIELITGSTSDADKTTIIDNANEFKDAMEILRRDAAISMSTDVKKMLNVYIPESYQVSAGAVYENAELVLSTAEKIDTGVLSITKVEDFTKLMTPIQKQYNAYASKYYILFEQQALIENYIKANNLNTAITKLKPNALEYRNEVTNLFTSYGAILPDYQKFVVKHANLLIAKADIDAAIKVEEIITALTNPEPKTTIANIEAARVEFNKLTSTQKKIVNNVLTLTTYEKNSKEASKVVNQIAVLDPSNKNFQSKTLAAYNAYTKLKTDAEKELVSNKDLLDQLLPTANALNAVYKLKATSITFTSERDAAKVLVDNAISKLSSETGILTPEQKAALNVILNGQEAIPAAGETPAIPAVIGLEKLLATATDVDNQIAALKDTTIEAKDLVPAIAAVRSAYDALLIEDKAAKNLVKNLKTLTETEKRYKDVLKVIALVNALDSKDPDYLKKVAVAKKAYDKLGATHQSYVTNYKDLEPIAKIAETITLIDGLDPKNKDYRAQVAKARTDYDSIVGATEPADLSTEIKLIYDDAKAKLLVLEPKLVVAEAVLSKADAFDKRITDLTLVSSSSFVSAVNAVLAAYKAMDATDKKLLQKAGILTDYEKSIKPVIKVIDLIAALDPSADDYTKKVIAARKAYDKLPTFEAKARVYNYNDLTKVEGVASVITRIAALNISNKTFIADLKDIRTAYDKLTTTEKKAVENYDVLVAFEAELVIAQKVIDLIKVAVPTAENYLDKLTAARNAYDSLESSQKKIVSNIKDLTDREKGVKSVLNVMKLIDQLDPQSKDFAKKVEAARAAYIKLDLAQRPLVSNFATLEGFEPAARVINMIATLKPGSETFHEDVKSARAAYTALGDKQSQVNNYNLLVSAEGNILGASGVDTLIYALKNNTPEEYVKKVQEARSAYNGLTATQKKAVKYADVLKEEEKYVKPVQTVIELIASMFTSSDMAKQFPKVQAAYSKLNAEQKTFVYNDYLISDLDNVIKVYNRIDKLKESDPTYVSLVSNIRSEYDRLTASEKTKVTNYDKLQEAEMKIELVKKVDEMIFALSPKSITYFDDIQLAMDQYKSLPSGLKKQLLYGSALLQADKDKKAAQKVIKQIQDIDENIRTFESKVLSADKAFKKLTVDQQKLVSNYRILQDYIDSL